MKGENVMKSSRIKSIVAAALAVMFVIGASGCASGSDKNELIWGVDKNNNYGYNLKEEAIQAPGVRYEVSEDGKTELVLSDEAYAACSDIAADMGVEFDPKSDDPVIKEIIEKYYEQWLSENLGTIIENPFVNTDEEKTSTFSADVDTASYTYFRRMVNAGYSFDEIRAYAGGEMRTEEMINYFKYNYTVPKDGELFGVNAEIAACPWNGSALLLTLGLSTEAKKVSAKNNLVFLIDVSGSMQSDDKLGLLKKAFSYLTAQLGADDIVSIVTYSGKEAVIIEACPGSKTKKIMAAVNSLTASGSTNGHAGLQKAYDIAMRHFIVGGNNRIIMASDGDLNVGISSPEELKNYVSDMRTSGVYLTTMGFGSGNYRDENMEALADNGNGVYYYIDCEAEAEKIFGGDLFATLYTVAEDVKLQLTFNPAAVKSYRLVGYENRVMPNRDFKDDTKDAGEIGAGHSVTVCYEIIPTETAMNEEEWMTLAVRYKDPGETAAKQMDYAFGASVVTENPTDDFKFICAVTEVSMLLHSSRNINEITLGDIAENLKKMADAGAFAGDEYKSAFAGMIGSLAVRTGGGEKNYLYM